MPPNSPYDAPDISLRLPIIVALKNPPIPPSNEPINTFRAIVIVKCEVPVLSGSISRFCANCQSESFMKPVLVVAALILFAAYSHVEEYCINEQGEIKPFYGKANSRGCAYKSWDPRCVKEVTEVSTQTFAYDSRCRGMVHYDSVFYLAQAAGFSGELAYFIAAYSQGVDFVQFVGIDSCGDRLPERFWTVPLRGFLRTSVMTGGTVHHLGVPFGDAPKDYSALKPDLSNYEYEGSLSTFRDWVFGDTDLICTAGYREPVEGNYFTGDKCLSPKVKIKNRSSKAVQGPIPLMKEGTRFGPGIAHYDCKDDIECSGDNLVLENVVMAKDMESYLASSSHGRVANGSPVPVELARLGIFMHYLADRASHNYCTDVKGNAIYSNGSPNDDLDLKLSVSACNAIKHGMYHFWEQMVKKPLSPQSYAALNLYYEQLVAFRMKYEKYNPEWFVRESLSVDQARAIIGTEMVDGVLDVIIRSSDPRIRYERFLEALDKAGYQRPPGWEHGSCATTI